MTGAGTGVGTGVGTGAELPPPLPPPQAASRTTKQQHKNLNIRYYDAFSGERPMEKAIGSWDGA